MECTPLSQLNQDSDSEKIKVCVSRVWRTKSTKNNKDISLESLDCLLIDDQGCAIQATMKPWHLHYFSTILEEGKVFEISNFSVGAHSQLFKVVSHDYIIDFAKKTQFRSISPDEVNIPRYKFDFVDFSDLPNKATSNEILTDLIGEITEIGGIEEIYTRDCMPKSLRRLVIQNIRDEKLNVTFWSDYATNFEVEKVERLTAPRVIVLAAMNIRMFRGQCQANTSSSTVYYIDPDILEVEEFRNRKRTVVPSLQIHHESGKKQVHPDELKQMNRKTIAELKSLDLEQNKGTTFTCAVKVINIDSTEGWWRRCCPICNITVEMRSSKIWCRECGIIKELPAPSYKLCIVGEDASGFSNFLIFGRAALPLVRVDCYDIVVKKGYEDPYILPPDFDKVIGQERVFLVKLSTKVTLKERFVVTKIFPSELGSQLQRISTSYPSDSTVLELPCPETIETQESEITTPPKVYVKQEQHSTSIKPTVQKELFRSHVSLGKRKIRDVDVLSEKKEVSTTTSQKKQHELEVEKHDESLSSLKRTSRKREDAKLSKSKQA